MYFIYNDDCFKILENMVKAGIKVDCIICDPPFGTTNISWDCALDYDRLIPLLHKVLRYKGRLVLFGTEPFYCRQMCKVLDSGLFIFNHEIIWNKKSSSCPMVAAQQPLRIHEKIAVYTPKKLKHEIDTEIKSMTYNPYTAYKVSESTKDNAKITDKVIEHLGDWKTIKKYNSGYTNFPKSIFECAKENKRHHPTAKPVALLEHLIKMYSNEGDIILDFTMGAGSTGIAATKLKRLFFGMEIEEQYFKLAKRRLEGNDAGLTEEQYKKLQNLEEGWEEQELCLFSMNLQD